LHALCPDKKTAILRNINRLNILIRANPGIIRTIAQFLTMRFFTLDLTGSGQYSAKKVLIGCVSRPEKPVATKIFINSQIERKYNPFR